MQVLLLSPEGEPKADVVVNYWFLYRSPSCYYQHQQWYFKLPDCELMPLGSLVQVIGTKSGGSDTALLERKRLVLSAVGEYCLHKSSVKCRLEGGVRYLFRFKNHLVETVIGYIWPSVVGVSQSVLFGERQQLSEEQSLLFETTGTQHLLSTSGFHVGIVASVLAGAQRLSRRWGWWLMLGGVWAYAVLVGLKAAVTRAVLMQTLGLLSSQWGRPYYSLWGVGVAAGLMLLWNPWYVIDVGFQLSVVATAAILFFSKHSGYDRWEAWVSGQVQLEQQSVGWVRQLKKYLESSVRVGISAQLGILPLLIYHFQEINLWSLVATVMVSWLFPLVMLGSLAVSIMAPLATFFAWRWLTFLTSLVGQAVSLVIWVFTEILARVSAWPDGRVHLEHLSWQVMCIWLLLLFWWYGRTRRARRRRSSYA